MFEHSLLVNDETKRPWSFLASLSVELAVVSLAVLLPLLYRDRLPVVHWKDIIVGPAPSAPPVHAPVSHPARGSIMPLSSAPHRVFVWNPSATSHAPVAATVDIGADAPPAILGLGIGGSTKSIGTLIPNVVMPPPPKPAVELPKQPSAPVPVGGDVQMAKLLRKVIPEYPLLARSARVFGVVRLIGIIGKDGTIRNLQLVSGHPLLARAAMEAVRQWVYRPTLLNGNPVEVIAPIEVNFTLGP